MTTDRRAEINQQFVAAAGWLELMRNTRPDAIHLANMINACAELLDEDDRQITVADICDELDARGWGSTTIEIEMCCESIRERRSMP